MACQVSTVLWPLSSALPCAMLSSIGLPLRRQKQGKNKAKSKEHLPKGGSASDLHGHLPKLCEDVDFLA